MAQARQCDYCGGDIEPGTGTMYVQVDGTVTHFCSSKCEKNADLGRESRDLEWTEAGQADSTPESTTPESTAPEAEPTPESSIDVEAEVPPEPEEKPEPGDESVESISEEAIVSPTEEAGESAEADDEAVTDDGDEAVEAEIEDTEE